MDGMLPLFEDTHEPVQEAQRLFISGPMTDVDDHNHPLFNKATADLRDAGFIVYNPAEFFAGDTTLPRHKYIRESLHWLLQADTIVMLPGWEKSDGATLEVMVARELGLQFAMYTDDGEPTTA